MDFKHIMFSIACDLVLAFICMTSFFVGVGSGAAAIALIYDMIKGANIDLLFSAAVLSLMCVVFLKIMQWSYRIIFPTNEQLRSMIEKICRI